MCGDVSHRTDVGDVVAEITRMEPLITPAKEEQVHKLVSKLQEKLTQIVDHRFYLFKVISSFLILLS